MLGLMELAERFAHEPVQLDTWLGSAGNRLSGGEARRVALAHEPDALPDTDRVINLGV